MSLYCTLPRRKDREHSLERLKSFRELSNQSLLQSYQSTIVSPPSPILSSESLQFDWKKSIQFDLKLQSFHSQFSSLASAYPTVLDCRNKSIVCNDQNSQYNGSDYLSFKSFNKNHISIYDQTRSKIDDSFVGNDFEEKNPFQSIMISSFAPTPTETSDTVTFTESVTSTFDEFTSSTNTVYSQTKRYYASDSLEKFFPPNNRSLSGRKNPKIPNYYGAIEEDDSKDDESDDDDDHDDEANADDENNLDGNENFNSSERIDSFENSLNDFDFLYLRKIKNVGDKNDDEEIDDEDEKNCYFDEFEHKRCEQVAKLFNLNVTSPCASHHTNRFNRFDSMRSRSRQSFRQISLRLKRFYQRTKLDFDVENYVPTKLSEKIRTDLKRLKRYSIKKLDLDHNINNSESIQQNRSNDSTKFSQNSLWKTKIIAALLSHQDSKQSEQSFSSSKIHRNLNLKKLSTSDSNRKLNPTANYYDYDHHYQSYRDRYGKQKFSKSFHCYLKRYFSFSRSQSRESNKLNVCDSDNLSVPPTKLSDRQNDSNVSISEQKFSRQSIASIVKKRPLSSTYDLVRFATKNNPILLENNSKFDSNSSASTYKKVRLLVRRFDRNFLIHLALFDSMFFVFKKKKQKKQILKRKLFG